MGDIRKSICIGAEAGPFADAGKFGQPLQGLPRHAGWPRAEYLETYIVANWRSTALWSSLHSW